MIEENGEESCYEIGDDELRELNDLRVLQRLIEQIEQEISVNHLDRAQHLVRMAKAKSKMIFSGRLEDIRSSSTLFSERNRTELDEMSI